LTHRGKLKFHLHQIRNWYWSNRYSLSTSLWCPDRIEELDVNLEAKEINWTNFTFPNQLKRLKMVGKFKIDDALRRLPNSIERLDLFPQNWPIPNFPHVKLPLNLREFHLHTSNSVKVNVTNLVENLPRKCSKLVIHGWKTFEENLLARSIIDLPDGLVELRLHGDNFTNYSHIHFPRTLMIFQADAFDIDTRFSAISFPSNLTELDLDLGSSADYYYGLEYEADMRGVNFPRGLKRLRLAGPFNLPFDDFNFPSGLLHFELGHYNCQPVDKLKLPSSLEFLRFGRWFNSPIDQLALPHSLIEIRFGHEFNQPLDQVKWPNQLKVLEFGPLFVQPLDALASIASLRELTLGCTPLDRDHPLMLPTSLTSLTFCSLFDGSIAGLKFPSTLLRVKFGDGWNQAVRPLILPPSLTELEFGYHFNRGMSRFRFPPSLRTLRFGHEFNQHPKLWISHLPSTLVELQFDRGFDHPLNRACLPSSILCLRLPSTDIADLSLEGIRVIGEK